MIGHRSALTLRLALIAVCGILFGPQPAAAHEGDHDHPPPKADASGVYRLTVGSDLIILTCTGNPATTQAFTWRTSLDVKKGVAQIAVAEADPAFAGKARTALAVSQPLKTNLSEARYHTAQFEGLSPGTRYAYRVGDGVN